jgi:hypothetical protein
LGLVSWDWWDETVDENWDETRAQQLTRPQVILRVIKEFVMMIDDG